jgi:hypothetical protein
MPINPSKLAGRVRSRRAVVHSFSATENRLPTQTERIVGVRQRKRAYGGRLTLAVVLLVGVSATTCDSRPRNNPVEPSPISIAPPADTGEEHVLVGAGDIGWCGSAGVEETARLLDRIPGTVFTTGDNAYPSGTARQFAECYEPTWGRHKARTFPAPGNHDYDTPGAAPYFAYFGARAGPAGAGYYSYQLGSWHIVSLNSALPGAPGSAQLRWLRSDLSARPARCSIAYWHDPLFSSGPNGNQPQMHDVWQLLTEFGVDIVIAGDDHGYERFAPQDASGFPDPERGIRQFVVGTGGAPLYDFGPPRPNSEVRIAAWGVLKLTLRSRTYSWDFVPASGGPADFGTDQCR